MLRNQLKYNIKVVNAVINYIHPCFDKTSYLMVLTRLVFISPLNTSKIKIVPIAVPNPIL